MNIDTFLKTQSDIVQRFESGFSGYRGLAGPTCRKPSPIVEKILQTLVSSEKEKKLQRKNSLHSWSTAPSSEISGIPSRFRLIDHKTIAGTVGKKRTTSKMFKLAAHSVLRSKNREWLKHQKDDEEEEDTLLDKIEAEKLGSENSVQTSVLERRESSFSQISTTSVDSDWSDEERERLDKIFGVMSAKAEIYVEMIQNQRSIERTEEVNSIDAPSDSRPRWDEGKFSFSRDSCESELAPSEEELDCHGLEGKNTYESDST